MSRITHVVVAVPAHNEEALLGRCVRSLGAAARTLHRRCPGISVDIIVALDRCTDGSAAVVSASDGFGVPSRIGGVGGARDTAIGAGLARAVGHSAATVWIANTDADTIVPTHWLTTQVELAEAGTDLVLGTVEPMRGVDPVVLARWWERHELVEGHGHVHGANLGMRATAWLTAGGFGPFDRNEDVGLASRLRAAGVVALSTDRTRVLTSARLAGRVDAGFADYLTDLAAIPVATSEFQPPRLAERPMGQFRGQDRPRHSGALSVR